MSVALHEGRRSLPIIPVVLREAPVLTPREWEVLRLLRDGLTQRAIMARLGISYRTVHHHVQAIHNKLDVSSTIEAVWAMRCELGCGRCS